MEEKILQTKKNGMVMLLLTLLGYAVTVLLFFYSIILLDESLFPPSQGAEAFLCDIKIISLYIILVKSSAGKKEPPHKHCAAAPFCFSFYNVRGTCSQAKVSTTLPAPLLRSARVSNAFWKSSALNTCVVISSTSFRWSGKILTTSGNFWY